MIDRMTQSLGIDVDDKKLESRKRLCAMWQPAVYENVPCKRHNGCVNLQIN